MGAKLFSMICAICHLNGIGGAPLPEKMNFDPQVVKEGKGVMPGFPQLTDEQLKQIEEYVKEIQQTR